MLYRNRFKCIKKRDLAKNYISFYIKNTPVCQFRFFEWVKIERIFLYFSLPK